MAEAVYDILGNAINAGDVIWQYRGYTQDARIGGVIYASSYGGRSRVKADGSFKRAFAPNSTVNLTAIGIPTVPRIRPEEYPDNMREFNRNLKYYASPAKWKERINQEYGDDSYSRWKDGWDSEIKYCDCLSK